MTIGKICAVHCVSTQRMMMLEGGAIICDCQSLSPLETKMTKHIVHLEVNTKNCSTPLERQETKDVFGSLNDTVHDNWAHPNRLQVGKVKKSFRVELAILLDQVVWQSVREGLYVLFIRIIASRPSA